MASFGNQPVSAKEYAKQRAKEHANEGKKTKELRAKGKIITKEWGARNERWTNCAGPHLLRPHLRSEA